MVSDQEATTTLKYSWNEGLTWDTFEFSKEPVEVEDIVIEPTSTGERFILHGMTTRGRGIIVALDFSSLHKRTCLGNDDPGVANSDYEIWSPRGPEECLLGHKISYVRRKRDSECFNPEEWDRPQRISFCACKEEDWECDSGFIRRSEGGPCERIDGKLLDFSPPKDCEGTYFASRGYRKIAGDTCFGGVDYSSIELPCPTLIILRTVDSVAIIAIFIGLFAIVVALALQAKPNSQGYEEVKRDDDNTAHSMQQRETSIDLGDSATKE
eukprot:TRINITY_DN4383_c0_g1_i5.p1 TRINITY_DN4383_c0_g1~~TRINITY_DN4383_c0_g1_i5.p1  ORF type:complete len:268 (+),score=51.92 TRINITY_DN4383_c0_g1_i5:110-913(+)